jgi:hypothetical protein
VEKRCRVLRIRILKWPDFSLKWPEKGIQALRKGLPVAACLRLSELVTAQSFEYLRTILAVESWNFLIITSPQCPLLQSVQGILSSEMVQLSTRALIWLPAAFYDFFHLTDSGVNKNDSSKEGSVLYSATLQMAPPLFDWQSERWLPKGHRMPCEVTRQRPRKNSLKLQGRLRWFQYQIFCLEASPNVLLDFDLWGTCWRM